METVFIRILNMSLAAAVAITAVLLVRLLLRRAPKKWSYLLWIAPAFRLCCPVSLKAAFSLFRLRPIAPAVQTLGAQTAAVAYVPQNIGTMAQPRLEIGTQRISETVSSVLPAPVPTASVNPLQIWLAVGAALWCAGMLAMLVYAAVSYVKTKRLLSDAVLLRDMVYETDRIRAPFLLGLFRPRIYVPAGLDEDTLRYVLAHERFHLRRGDHVVKALAFLLLTVHWFNPLCWLAFALMSRDMEMRCDESVLAAQGNCGKEYSRALLSFAAGRRFPAPSPLAFGETGVKARIRNALRWKKPRAWASILAAVLCLAVVAACAANPAEKPDENPSAPDAPSPSLPTSAPVPASAEIPRGPAGLEIAARQGSIAAWLGSYSWDCDLGDGVRQGVEADAMHPLDPQAELPLLTVHPDTVSQSRPDYVTLRFDFEPDSLSVVCWDDARQPDASEPGERVTLEKQDGRFGFTLRSGSWVYMITASWRQAQYGGLAYYAFRGSSPTLTVDPALFGPVWTTVSCGGDDAVPLTVMRYARTWTGDGWLEADGIPIETTLAENVDSIPTLTWSEDFSVLFSPGIYRRTGIRIYNEDFQPRVLDRETPREWWEGDAGVHWLEPGSYYAVLGIYGPLGRYIEEEDKYEESGWDCVFRLVVPEGGPLAYTPGDAHDLVSARIGSVTLTDAPSLRTLERWLSGAELLPGGAKCPFSSMLWLTRADGATFSLCPAEDSCGTLFSAGAYYKYAGDNEAFWALFGIERDEDGALMIP